MADISPAFRTRVSFVRSLVLHVMGNSLSVSSIVDDLHALQPAERSEALDNLYKQHDEIREYLKSRYHWGLEPPQKQQSGQPKPRQPHLQAIYIKNIVPEEQRFTEKEYSSWSGEPSRFWTSSSYTFLPPEACQEPLRFIYDATTRIEPQIHEDCLRRRYLALFWFDYFNARYPEQQTAFDHEYEQLARYVLGLAIVDSDATVSALREQVKAGRKYNMLTRKFGDGILLTLPSSIGKSTLERKLPLDQETFDTWIAPVVGSIWEEQAKTDGIRALGQRIRQIILQRCGTVAAVQETVSIVPSITAGSPATPIAPSTLPQVREIPQDVEDSHGRIFSTNPAGGVLPRAFIPPLFCAMGSHIPKIMVDRALSPQARWSEYGEFVEITPQDAGLHRDLVDFLSDETKLKQDVEELVSRSILHKEVSTDSLQTYTCQHEPARILYNQNRAYWIHRAFELCCYVFPRNQILESSFGSVGKQLLHVLQHLLQLYAEMGLEIPSRRDTVETLVAASKFGGMSNRKYLLKVAAELHKDPEQTDTQAMIVHRESVLLRLCRKISDSQRVIQQFLDRPFIEANPRLHSLVGLLQLSQAENWAYHFNHQKVYEEAQKWGPGDNPSTMQIYVLRTKLKVLGQSYKGNGLFEDAKSAFEGCLAAMKPHDSERFLIKSHLADTYCEVDYLKRKEFVVSDVAYLEEAEKLVSPEIEYLRTRGRDPRQFRRLLLSLVEIEIIRGRHSVAECLVEELLAVYNKLTEHDINDQVGHVRTLIAWARLSEPSKAVVRWHNAVYWNKIYNPSEEDVFTCGVIYLFISLAYFKLGNADESWASFNRAAEIISRKQPQFLIPGVGTYLYDFARRELWSVAGWILPRKTP